MARSIQYTSYIKKSVENKKGDTIVKFPYKNRIIKIIIKFHIVELVSKIIN